MSTKVAIPEVSEILKTGLQFGHNTSRWNPLMGKYIFSTKNDIHIIDVVQTRELLTKAVEALEKYSSQGEIIFIGSKKQAADFVREESVRVGAHFVANRWPGGLLTNFPTVQRSIHRLRALEKMFAEGVEGRTKYEVTRMKNEWQRLNRLYGGVKQMDKPPVAAVIIDPKFEKVGVRECRKLHIPIIALADTNCNPKAVDYVIPGNDDALRSIQMILKVLADAVLAGNEGKGVKHDLQDYAQTEVKLIKTGETAEEVEAVELELEPVKTEESPKAVRIPEKKTKTKVISKQKGILEVVKEQQEADRKAKNEKK